MNANQDSHRPSPFAPEILTRLVTLLAVAGILLGGVAIIIYRQERNHEALLLRQQATQRLDKESEFLAGEIESIRSDVLYLAEQETLQRFLEGHDDARHELAREYSRFATRRAVYDQIRFLDTTGKEVVRVNFRDGQAKIVPGDELQAKSDRYYYRDALNLNAGEVFVSEFDLNVEHGQIEQPLEPMLRLLTPVIDRAGNTRGLMALNYSGDQLLRRLSEFPVPGSTLLINSAGEYIRGPTPADSWGWLLGHARSFSSQFPLAWRQIAETPAGQFSNGEGMFAFRRVAFSEPLPTRSRVSQNTGGDIASLVLVVYLPPDLQYASSNKLLRQMMWMHAGAMTLLVVLGWYWARSAAIRKRQATSIMASEARLRMLSDQLLVAQEDERRIISRELHDDLGQQVTAITLDLRSAARQQDADRARKLLDRAIEETDHLLKSVHEVASRVRPSVLDDLGLHDAVESLTSDVGERTGVTVTTNLDFGDRTVTPKVGENVYRILQEGLMNIVKHADTQHACVAIQVVEGHLQMTIEDQGTGFEESRRDGSRLGILGMQERTELLGGRFTLSSRPGTGTRIDVRIPLQNDKN